MSNKLTSGSACEGDKFLIEVTGIGHGEEQGFDFFDETDMEHQEALGNKKTIDPELEASTIYSWDWEEETEKRNVWLKVSADGDAIRLPLFEGVDKVSRKEKRQDYQLCATVPLTILPSFNKDISEKERLAPLRDGYLYVFYNDLAWREIKVSVLEEEMTFNDVDLYQYRESRDTAFTSDDRIPTGDNLKDIWLPSRNKNANTNIRIAFSDVQWSAERLNFLEANISEMRKRCVSLHSLKIDREEGLLAADTLAEMRLRELQVEMICAEPRCINQDLSGNYIQDLYKKVKSDIDDARKNGDKAEAIYYPQDRPYQFDFSLQVSALSSLLGSENLEEDTWQALGSSQDYLADAKTRKLICFALEDKTFDLKHNALLVSSGAGYFQQILIDIGQQEHFKSAELVQRFVMPEEFAGKKNPFHEHIQKTLTKDYSAEIVTSRLMEAPSNNLIEKPIKSLSKTYFDKAAPFQRTIRTIERLQCRKDVRSLQLALEDKMNDKSLALVIKDSVSLSGSGSIVAYKLVSDGLSALNINLDKLDSICIEKKEANPCFNTAKKILSSRTHPLNPVITLPDSEKLMEDGYVKKTPSNDGSGLTTVEKIAQWADKNLIIEDEKLKSFDLAFMSKSSSNEEGVFGTVRRSAHVISGIFGGFFETAAELNELMLKVAKEAISIEFNTAYASALALARAADPKTLGEMTFKSLGGKEMKGVIVGVEGHGLKNGLLESEKQHIEKQSKNNKAKGSLLNRDGKLVAATNKKKALKGNVHSIKTPLKVAVLPEGSELIDAFSKTATERSLVDMNKVNRFGTNASDFYEKVRIPYFITIVEIINIRSNLHHFQNIKKEGEKLYSGANIFSIILDLTVALAHASNMATQNAGFIATASNSVAFETPVKIVDYFNRGEKTVKIVQKLNYIKTFGLGAGLLTAGIAFWDTVRLVDANDDAAMAMGMIAIGTGMTSIATGLFTTSAPILFGMGPIAWLGIALAVGGGLLYMYFKDSPIEIWLKNGPFGLEGESYHYGHLKDPKIAFSKLMNLVINVSIKVYDIEKESQLGATQLETAKKFGATHGVFLQSNAPQLLNDTSLETHMHIRQSIKQVTERATRIGRDLRHAVEFIKIDKKDTKVLFEEHLDNGILYYIKHTLRIPKNGQASGAFSYFKTGHNDYLKNYPGFVARFQFRIEDSIFPNGDMKEGKLPKGYEVVNFNDKDVYWYQNQPKFPAINKVLYGRK
ncbi:MAG: toxin VasX [Marinomonas sp.]